MPPDGTIRQSQLVTTFGPGAMVDLVNYAVLIGGLDTWRYEKGDDEHAVHERRLQGVIAGRLGAIGRELSAENPFRTPPFGDDRAPSRQQGIAALEFPRWFVCQNPSCRALVHQAKHDLQPHPKTKKYQHRCEKGGVWNCVPVRFVMACARGHMDDVHWPSFVHPSPGGCSTPALRWVEGAVGNFEDIAVRCKTCGNSVPLRNAWNRPYGTCTGARPWLGSDAKESSCQAQMRPLVRTASNSYFPQLVSVVSIPEAADDLTQRLGAVWNRIQEVTDASDLAYQRKKSSEVRAALEGWSDDAILEGIGKKRAGDSEIRLPIRTAEYPSLARAAEETAGEIAPPDAPFFARRIRPAPDPLPPGVAQFVTVSKMREVVTQVGFTRLEPATADVQGEYDLGVHTASLSLQADWLPAYEIRGEGIFLELKESAVATWLKRPEVTRRVEQLRRGYNAWVSDLGPAKDNPPPFLGARYYLLHTLSHLLMTSISLECGYPASALRERIYCGPSEGDATPMAGILLSTGTAGTGGTLGGLAEQARHLGAHLQRAWDAGTLCSNDPICAAHDPADNLTDRLLEGAACHGCVYVAECSCERFNRYMDRALVFPALGHPAELAFFQTRS